VEAGLILVLLLILGAEFVNGWTDSPNAIATVVGTRSLTPLQAVVMAAVLNLLGVLSGTVAATIGKGIIDERHRSGDRCRRDDQHHLVVFTAFFGTRRAVGALVAARGATGDGGPRAPGRMAKVLIGLFSPRFLRGLARSC
jgi:hypothetical protein